ncbi:unnamed protein product [Clonostachys chloroleuca]|uniref:FAD-binding PCMH-type domain-containing protein n=1 Tax=Clonostachys chloroleuca TaxID=1926264 RepID=A0AA35VR66_9HYPO|nr:unnamed protein product [Clonostachys chloroleuca]
MAPTENNTREFFRSLGLTNASSIKLSSSSPVKAAVEVLQLLNPSALDHPGTESYKLLVRPECIPFHEALSYPGAANRSQRSAAVVQEAAAIFHPSSAGEVAAAIRVFEHFQTPFAIRSGGHQTARGAAAIKDGVLVSLDRLNSIAYSEDDQIIRFGPGNRWISVYEHLHKYGRGVTGGHIGIVGTGGHITGGGTSPFIHRHGFSCTNVKNFEVVLSGGRIVNANLEQNADLLWALRGGASNFGVVTRMDMYTFPLLGVWGGSIIHDISKKEQILDAFWKFQFEGIINDPGAEMLLGFSIVGDSSRIQSEVSADRIGHAEGAFPPAFQPFFDIGLDFNDTRDYTLPELARSTTENTPPEFALWFAPEGRMNFAMVTFRPDREFYTESVDIFYEVFEPARRLKDAQINLHISALQGKTVTESKARGSIATGWAEEDQLMYNMEMVWSQAEDDELVFSLSRKCVNRVKAAAEKRGLLLPTIWMNNAHQDDDVLASYGEANLTKMKQVSQKYDAKQTFQKLCSGPFKLDSNRV